MATKMLRPNVGIYVATADAFADFKAPTLSEITDATKVFNISPAITDDYTLNQTESDSDDSLAIVDNADVQTPTYFNYEASLEIFRDENTSADSVYNKAYDLFKTVDTEYFLIKRIGFAHDAAFAEGQEISVYGVSTDLPYDIVGDGEMIRCAAAFLVTGKVAINVAVTAGTAGAGPELKSVVGTKSTSNGKIKVIWVPLSNITGTEDEFLADPSVADMVAAGSLDLTESIAFDGYDLGAGESNRIEDRGIVDTTSVESRGFAQFSGNLTFFRGVTSESSGNYYNAYEAFKASTSGTRPQGMLVTRVNIEQSTALAVGQLVSVFKFTADAFMDDTEGEDSVKFMVNFAPQGKVSVNATTVA